MLSTSLAENYPKSHQLGISQVVNLNTAEQLHLA